MRRRSVGVVFGELLDEAESRPVIGWDFSWLGKRVATSSLPWSYAAILLDRARQHSELLDMGTGGGEFLASLRNLPRRTVATESWPPNVEAAHRRLQPLGVGVVEVEAALDNVDQATSDPKGRLPFVDCSFGLIANRHESFVASEIARVLVTGGAFVTQQLGGDSTDFYDALGLAGPTAPTFTLEIALGQLEDAGLQILECERSDEMTTFFDVGAFAWYLKAVPWIVDGFSIDAFRPQLRQVHDRIGAHGPLTTRHRAFMISAFKGTGPGRVQVRTT
jgi:hypothetical protein